MAKRGETRPWKVRFEWTSGIKGVSTYTSEDEAEMHADKIRRYGELREEVDVTVTVTHEPKTAPAAK